MGTVLILVVLVLLFGGFPAGMYAGPYRNYYGGGLGLLLLIVILLLVFGGI